MIRNSATQLVFYIKNSFPVTWQKVETPQDLYHGHLGLQHGKPHPNTRPRSLSEPYETVRAARLPRCTAKVVRIELSRVGVDALVHMDTDHIN